MLVPIQTRAVTCPFRKDAHPGLPERRADPGGTGVETVRAIRCCPTFAARLERQRGQPLTVTG